MEKLTTRFKVAATARDMHNEVYCLIWKYASLDTFQTIEINIENRVDINPVPQWVVEDKMIDWFAHDN